MIVLVIVGVLLSIAAPSYSVLSLRVKLKSYANELVASLYLARGEAIKRNAPMILCTSNTAGDACDASVNWDQGWIVIDPDLVVVRHQQAVSSGIKVFELSDLRTITFQPSGILSTAAIMIICQDSPTVGIEERKVTFSTTSRQRVQAIPKGDADFTDCTP